MTDSAPILSEDLDRLDNVLVDTHIPSTTRRSLITRAAAGVAGAGVLGALGSAPAALASGNGINQIVTDAVTAEALAVTFLTTLITKLGTGLGPALDPLKAANQAEQDHFAFLTGAGFKPQTTKFWIPDAAFVPANVAPTIEKLETIFVNAYLIGTTVFATASNATLARYAAEIAGVEAEHRTLARQLQGKLPDNVAFESYTVKTLSQIVSEITDLGIGFGQQGSSPGAFYTYGGTTPSTVLSLDTNAPDDKVAFTLPTLVAAPRKRTVKQAKKPTHKARRATAPRSMPKGNPKLTG